MKYLWCKSSVKTLLPWNLISSILPLVFVVDNKSQPKCTFSLFQVTHKMNLIYKKAEQDPQKKKKKRKKGTRSTNCISEKEFLIYFWTSVRSFRTYGNEQRESERGGGGGGG